MNCDRASFRAYSKRNKDFMPLHFSSMKMFRSSPSFLASKNPMAGQTVTCLLFQGHSLLCLDLPPIVII